MKLTREQVDYRLLREDEKDEAIQLCIKVFRESYGDIPAPAHEQFSRSLTRPGYKESLDMYGAFADGRLIGVLGMKAGSTYLSLLYIDVNWQGTGLAGIMLRTMIGEYAPRGPVYTLASSSKVGMYRHIGFVPTDTEQSVNGFSFVPMAYFKIKDYVPEYYKSNA